MSDNNFFRISNVNIPANSPLENQNNPAAAPDNGQTSAGSAGVPDSIGSEDYQFSFGWASGEDLFDSFRAVESGVSFIRSELAKPDPDESAMFQQLMSLTPDQDVAVLHELRTNGDIYRLIDDLFSNLKVAPQMGELSEKLKGVLSKYPGIEDIISEIDKRFSSLPKSISSQAVTSNTALSVLSDGAVDIGGAGEDPSASDFPDVGWPTPPDDPLADFQRGIDSTYNFIENELPKADPDEKAMFQKLYDLTPEQEVAVIHQLRTNNDIYHLLDELFSNPSVAPKMQQLLDKLKSVLPERPGIQDIVDEIEKRIAALPPSSLTSRLSAASDALSALTDGTVDVGGIGIDAPLIIPNIGWPSSQDPFADFQRGIDSAYSFIEDEISKTDPDESAMLQKLLDLSPQQDVMVIHQLRTNDDIYRFLDEIFSNPSVRPQIQDFLDRLKSVVSMYPGIQDIISEIEKRMM